MKKLLSLLALFACSCTNQAPVQGPITINIYYTGTNGAARSFMDEMVDSGIVEQIRAEEGNIQYDYFIPVSDPESVLLIDKWADQASLDIHHATPMMAQISKLREKYDLHMRVERYVSAQSPESDSRFQRK